MAPTRAGTLGLACVVGLSSGLLGTGEAASARDRDRPAAAAILEFLRRPGDPPAAAGRSWGARAARVVRRTR